MTAFTALASVEEAHRDSLAVRETPDFRADAGSRLIAHHNAYYDTLDFQVCIFEGPTLSRNAATLFEGAYARLGYVRSQPQVKVAAGVTLEAVAEDDRVLGTLSITVDSSRGIQAQALYANEIANFRQRGKICEFTRLAIDTASVGREVLCSLFYVAYVYAHVVRGATDLFIEVNPRHGAFYKRMLGFKQLGDVKTCARVGAPAILLHLDFRYTAMQIERARQGLSVDSSKLYQHAAAAGEERLLVSRIQNSGLCLE